ncbi:MAG: helix-turn-helix transcriptional regulator [Planctomycetes bacterium]|nr:helix-turn-helix transcriptional regulator [Planctomycetota bacterium]
MKPETLLQNAARLKGMTLAQLATKIGVSTRTVTNWNQGNSRPTGKSVNELINAGISQKVIANPSKEAE